MLSLSNSRPAFEKVTCNCSYTLSFTHDLRISGLASVGTSFSTVGIGSGLLMPGQSSRAKGSGSLVQIFRSLSPGYISGSCLKATP